MKIAIIPIALLVALSSFSQTNLDFSTELIGNWNGDGSLFGYEARLKMQWTKVLNEKFLKLSFRNEFTDNAGNNRDMTAIGFYDLKTKKGYWFDSRGIMLPLVLEIDNEAMTVDWGDENTEKGRTIYKAGKKNEIYVEDYFLKDNKFNLFGKAKYHKVID